jgi:hypothetical protein
MTAQEFYNYFRFWPTEEALNFVNDKNEEINRRSPTWYHIDGSSVVEWGNKFESLAQNSVPDDSKLSQYRPSPKPIRLTYPQFQNKQGGVCDDDILPDVNIFNKDGQLDLSCLYIDMEK